MTNIHKVYIAILLITIATSLRLLPHLWNFTPITAIILFSSFYFDKKYAIVIMITSLLLSDLFLGFYDWRLMAVVYASYLITVLAGSWVKKYNKIEVIIAGSLISSIAFFMITNFAVWAFSSWYPHNFEGLMQCYYMALPFFRNSMLGDLFYCGVFFGIYESVKLIIQAKSSSKIMTFN